jgi:hypothetical protein
MSQGNDLNATAFIFQVKNRFPKDYRDKQEVEQTGNGFRAVWQAIANSGNASESESSKD